MNFSELAVLRKDLQDKHKEPTLKNILEIIDFCFIIRQALEKACGRLDEVRMESEDLRAFLG